MAMKRIDSIQKEPMGEGIEVIKSFFPNCVTEAADENGNIQHVIDFDVLRQDLSDHVVEGPKERYEFTWPGKRNSILLANAPTTNTLRPLPEKSVDFEYTKNVYIEGDNLEALKILRETYMGKVKMIYIDPPYNTGNDFVYKDDFKETTEEYVRSSGNIDEEGCQLEANSSNDGKYHSNWLNMMYPRLALARDLLRDDGVIFISIDHNEFDNLKKQCDQVFGSSSFVNCVSWRKTYAPKNNSTGIPDEVEYVMVYSKMPYWTPNRLPRTEEMDARYQNPDNDSSPWKSGDAFAPGAASHQGMVYAIQSPFTGSLIYPYNGGCWRSEQNQLLNIMCEWTEYHLEDIHDEERRAKICGITADKVRKGVKAMILSKPLEEAKRDANAIMKRGQWPLFYFTKNGEGGISRKVHLDNLDGKLPTNYWPHELAGHNDEAKKELKRLFNGETPFDTPKPVRLMQLMLQIATDKDSLVMDFFSGSASTAEAVFRQNLTDNGTRKFILVQLPETSLLPQYQTLCDVGEERIRRAGKEIKKANPLIAPNLDLGFRTFKVDSSNMKDVEATPEATQISLLEDQESAIKEDRTDMDLVVQTMLRLGITLDADIVKKVAGGGEAHTTSSTETILYVVSARIYPKRISRNSQGFIPSMLLLGTIPSLPTRTV